MDDKEELLLHAKFHGHNYINTAAAPEVPFRRICYHRARSANVGREHGMHLELSATLWRGNVSTTFGAQI